MSSAPAATSSVAAVTDALASSSIQAGPTVEAVPQNLEADTTTTTSTSTSSALANDILIKPTVHDVDVGSTGTAQDNSIKKEEEKKDDTAASADALPSAPANTIQSIYEAHSIHRDEAIAARAKQRTERKAAIRAQAEVHKQVGDLLVSQNKLKASLPQYQESTRLCPSNPTYHISLATAFRKLGWYEEAAHSCTVALTLSPKSSEARYLRGVSRLSQKMLKPAKVDFETVLTHDPTHFLSRAALAEVNRFLSASNPSDPAIAAALNADAGGASVDPLDYSFPPPDYENLEVASVSDSDESNHVGNGVPCRFYNQLGCVKGQNCEYSHAPDERSVRDLLGRNVCIWFLLDSCKFGMSKCVYSHRRDALPMDTNGWWTDPARIAKVKATIEGMEQKKKDLRVLEQERIRMMYRSAKANAHSNPHHHAKPLKSAVPKVGEGEGGEKPKKKVEISVNVEGQSGGGGQRGPASARPRDNKNKKANGGAKATSPTSKASKAPQTPATPAATAPTVIVPDTPAPTTTAEPVVFNVIQEDA